VPKNIKSIIRNFSKRIYFLHCGKDLNRQDVRTKNIYDNIVIDIISEIPSKCPLNGCDGIMNVKDNNMMCNKCEAVYVLLVNGHDK